jgi:hypothetical protein
VIDRERHAARLPLSPDRAHSKLVTVPPWAVRSPGDEARSENGASAISSEVDVLGNLVMPATVARARTQRDAFGCDDGPLTSTYRALLPHAGHGVRSQARLKSVSSRSPPHLPQRINHSDGRRGKLRVTLYAATWLRVDQKNEREEASGTAHSCSTNAPDHAVPNGPCRSIAAQNRGVAARATRVVPPRACRMFTAYTHAVVRARVSLNQVVLEKEMGRREVERGGCGATRYLSVTFPWLR